MTAATLARPLIIEQGATWRFGIVWKDSDDLPVDLTGCQARMQLRRYYSEPVLLDLSTTDGTLTIDPLQGAIDAVVSDQTTALLAVGAGIFDLEIYYPDGEVVRLLQGRWVNSLEVTK